MHTAPECITCFFKQAVSMAEKTGMSTDEQLLLLKDLMKELADNFDPTLPPPQHAAAIQHQITLRTGEIDPFLAEKQMSNREVLAVVPALESIIGTSEDPLREAVLLAIAGNIIDFGVLRDINVADELKRIMQQERSKIHRENSRIFAYDRFVQALASARTLLYLGDNNGEVVLDRLLLKEIRRQFPAISIVFAVRDIPVLNDVTVDDAREVGIDVYAEVLSSGSTLPGTVLSRVSQEFLEVYRAADVVISKGQGNFESLSGFSGREIFYLFMAKCKTVANFAGAHLYDIVLTCME
jgi:damage-control phosphatase, subfamily I